MLACHDPGPTEVTAVAPRNNGAGMSWHVNGVFAHGPNSDDSPGTCATAPTGNSCPPHPSHCGTGRIGTSFAFAAFRGPLSLIPSPYSPAASAGLEPRTVGWGEADVSRGPITHPVRGAWGIRDKTPGNAASRPWIPCRQVAPLRQGATRGGPEDTDTRLGVDGAGDWTRAVRADRHEGLTGPHWCSVRSSSGERGGGARERRQNRSQTASH
jgi:hypothetical protein